MIEYANVVTRTYFHIFSIFMFRAQLRWLGRILRELEMMLFGKSFLNQILFTPLPRPRSLTLRRARRKRGRPLFPKYKVTREDRNYFAAIAFDRRRFQAFVER